jgi:putative FmdB family regulatory protein
MPTYDYNCPICHYEAEIFHKINDKIPVVCPNCLKTEMVKRPTGGLSVHFKGSGFYETDYKGK